MTISKFEDFDADQEIRLEDKGHARPPIRIRVDPDDRITSIDNPDMADMPFRPGARMKWSRLSSWACENGYLVDGKDTCPTGGGFLRSNMDRLFGA